MLDVYGRCIREIDNMGQVTENEYDSLGNLIYQKDRNGIVTRYQYDGLSRNTEKTNDKNGFLQYEYTDFGEGCGITDGTAKQKVKYNAFGETTQIIRDKTSDFFEYDDEGRLVSKTIEDKDMGTVQNRYTYDKRGNVTSIETGMGIEYITYDKAGRVTKKENSQSGISKTYSYYPTGLVKDVLTWQNDEVVYTESYEYDQNGNKIYEDLNGEIKRYAYDGMSRLKTVTDKDGNITEYEFDDFGNISKEYDISERGIKTKQYYYDSNNRLIMSDSPNETVQYEYDNSGNLLEKTTGYGGRIKKTFYRYDGYNRLSEYISGDVVSEYTYNLDGLRESKTVGGKYTRFMYDGMNIIGELCEGDYYIYHRGTELIGYQSYSGKSYYYRQDSHGNVTALLDFSGNEVKNYKYDAYGEPQGTRLNPAGDQTIIYQWKAETEKVYNPFGFCGEYSDAEPGLIYLRNRYYDPSTGRFINEDPIRDGLNWYAYCGNNPVMFVDPWGLDYDDVIADLSTIVSAKARMLSASKSSTEYRLAYQNAMQAKESISKDVIYIENLDGLRSILSPIVEGDNNSLQSLKDARSSVETALNDYNRGRNIDDIVTTGLLTAGGAVAIKAGVGALAGKIATKVAPAIPTIGQISQHTQEHIMQSKHEWGRVVSDPNSWKQVSNVVINVVKNGTESAYGSALQKTMQIKNEIVVVTYKIVDGVIRISDGWVKTK